MSQAIEDLNEFQDKYQTELCLKSYEIISFLNYLVLKRMSSSIQINK